jgi:hypothetical protein
MGLICFNRIHGNGEIGMVYYWVYYILGDWEDGWELNTMVNMGFHVLCGRETFTVFPLFLLFVRQENREYGDCSEPQNVRIDAT